MTAREAPVRGIVTKYLLYIHQLLSSRDDPTMFHTPGEHYQV